MNKHNQHGFGAVGALVVIGVVAVIGLVAFRVMKNSDKKFGSTNTQQNKRNDAGNNQAKSDKSDDLKLQNFGLASFDSVDVTANALREYSSKGLKGFYIFGDSLSGGRINPNYEFASVKEGTKVVAAIDGVVAFIKEQPESNDSEVFLQTYDGSKWVIGYDHLTNLVVKKGDAVKVGDVLGEPARQNNGLLRFEFQVNQKQSAGDDIHVCPSTSLDASIKDKVLGELSTMQTSWNTLSGMTLYDLQKQNPVGCLSETMTVQQAEGR